jgi:hypothetical protein
VAGLPRWKTLNIAATGDDHAKDNMASSTTACRRGPPGQGRPSVKEATRSSMPFTIGGPGDALTQGAPWHL